MQLPRPSLRLLAAPMRALRDVEKRQTLRWLVISSVTALAAAVSAVILLPLIPATETRIGAGAVLALFTIGLAYAGRLCWRLDTWDDPARYERDSGFADGPQDVKSDLDHLDHFADLLPWGGLIFTMIGIFLLFLASRSHGGAAPDPRDLVQHVSNGMATVFIPSIVGAVGSRVLDTIRHVLEHEIDHH